MRVLGPEQTTHKLCRSASPKNFVSGLNFKLLTRLPQLPGPFLRLLGSLHLKLQKFLLLHPHLRGRTSCGSALEYSASLYCLSPFSACAASSDSGRFGGLRSCHICQGTTKIETRLLDSKPHFTQGYEISSQGTVTNCKRLDRIVEWAIKGSLPPSRLEICCGGNASILSRKKKKENAALVFTRSSGIMRMNIVLNNFWLPTFERLFILVRKVQL